MNTQLDRLETLKKSLGLLIMIKKPNFFNSTAGNAQEKPSFVNNNKKTQKNVLLKDYLRYFMKNYDNNCIIFYYFYEKLYSDLNLTNMINQSFIKEI